MKWKKINRLKDGKLTDVCKNEMIMESEQGACYLLINEQRRVSMYLTRTAFVDEANCSSKYTHYCVVYYPAVAMF